MKCVKCKLPILEREEKYVGITDFDKGKRIAKVFLHIRCWKTMFAEGITKALRERVKQVMGVYQ